MSITCKCNQNRSSRKWSEHRSEDWAKGAQRDRNNCWWHYSWSTNKRMCDGSDVLQMSCSITNPAEKSQAHRGSIDHTVSGGERPKLQLNWNAKKKWAVLHTREWQVQFSSQSSGLTSEALGVAQSDFGWAKAYFNPSASSLSWEIRFNSFFFPTILLQKKMSVPVLIESATSFHRGPVWIWHIILPGSLKRQHRGLDCVHSGHWTHFSS